MQFRMKPKYWQATRLTADNYDPNASVLPGCHAWRMRIAANDLYQAGRTAKYEAAKQALFQFLNNSSETRKKSGPVILKLNLKHGDMVVMHGREIQEKFDVRTCPIS